jgi:hypothetical protein
VLPEVLSRIDWQQVEQEKQAKIFSGNTAVASKYAARNECTLIEFDTEQHGAFMCPLATINQAELHARFPTVSDIRTALPDCPDFAPMYNFLSTNELPADDKVARRITYEAPNFILEDGLLWFLHTPRTKKLDRAYAITKRLCISRIFRERIALGIHDDNSHAGFSRALATARLLFQRHVHISQKSRAYMSGLSRSETANSPSQNANTANTYG